MRKARLWIVALWTTWVLCFLGLLLLWYFALSSSTRFMLNGRQIIMVSHLRVLSQAFASMDKLQRELLDDLTQEAAHHRLTIQSLKPVRSQAYPYFDIYWLRLDGKPVLPGDRPAPAWIAPLVRSRLSGARGVVMVRPLPPGLEAGNLPSGQPSPPDSYLLACQSGGETMLVSVANLNYVFGTWLENQRQHFELGDDLVFRRMSADETWRDTPVQPPQPLEDKNLVAVYRESPTWRWKIGSFLEEEAYPFDAVEVTLHNQGALNSELRWYGLAPLIVGGLLMLAFALSIRLAAQGVRREVELSEARSRFTAMVSHELRTPIAAVRMYSEILENHLVDDPAKLDEYHHIIGEQAHRLEKLVESLLEVGAIERGTRSFRLAPTDLNDLAEQARKEILRDSRSEVSVELKLDNDLPLANADRDAMLQVLENLMRNAIKYGLPPPQGEAWVTVATRAVPAGVAVDVLDRGPGIPTAERRKVFMPYHRLRRDHDAAKQGVGLGLAVVKGFMEGQKGSVAVHERPGGGCAITVTLPQS